MTQKVLIHSKIKQPTNLQQLSLHEAKVDVMFVVTYFFIWVAQNNFIFMPWQQLYWLLLIDKACI